MLGHHLDLAFHKSRTVYDCLEERIREPKSLTHKPSIISSHLVNEGGKAVVEALDLLFLLGAHNLDVGVNLKVEGSKQAPVDSHSSDRGLGNQATSKSSSIT